MGFLKSAMKTGVAMKAAGVLKREASKPENQRKAKSMLGKVTSRGNRGSRKQHG